MNKNIPIVQVSQQPPDVAPNEELNLMFSLGFGGVYHNVYYQGHYVCSAAKVEAFLMELLDDALSPPQPNPGGPESPNNPDDRWGF